MSPIPAMDVAQGPPSYREDHAPGPGTTEWIQGPVLPGGPCTWPGDHRVDTGARLTGRTTHLTRGPQSGYRGPSYREDHAPGPGDHRVDTGARLTGRITHLTRGPQSGYRGPSYREDHAHPGTTEWIQGPPSYREDHAPDPGTTEWIQGPSYREDHAPGPGTTEWIQGPVLPGGSRTCTWIPGEDHAPGTEWIQGPVLPGRTTHLTRGPQSGYRGRLTGRTMHLARGPQSGYRGPSYREDHAPGPGITEWIQAPVLPGGPRTWPGDHRVDTGARLTGRITHLARGPGAGEIQAGARHPCRYTPPVKAGPFTDHLGQEQ